MDGDLRTGLEILELDGVFILMSMMIFIIKGGKACMDEGVTNAQKSYLEIWIDRVYMYEKKKNPGASHLYI